jgi:hypothetical protein
MKKSCKLMDLPVRDANKIKGGGGPKKKAAKKK